MARGPAERTGTSAVSDQWGDGSFPPSLSKPQVPTLVPNFLEKSSTNAMCKSVGASDPDECKERPLPESLRNPPAKCRCKVPAFHVQARPRLAACPPCHLSLGLPRVGRAVLATGDTIASNPPAPRPSCFPEAARSLVGGTQLSKSHRNKLGIGM